jgi:hypothetical protein
MPGVYELADEAKILIYIGQSTRDAPNRIRQHLERNLCVRERVHFWRYAYSRVPKAEEANELEKHRQAKGDLPPCNRVQPNPRNGVRRYSERTTGD